MDSRAIVGSGPRSFAIDPSGKMLYVACTDGAGIYGFSIDVPSGILAPLAGSPFRNLGLRPAAITVDFSGQFAFVPNNASKNVSVFRVNPQTGQLTAIAAPYASGTAPVWANIDKSGTYLYVLSDVDDAIYAYSVATTGTLSKLSTPAFHGVADPLFSTLSPNGNFLYVPNWFSSGSFPANSVSVFSIDPTTGKLTPITGSPFATGAGLTSIAFEPSGKFAYLTNELAGTVSEFSVNSSNGAMRARPTVAKAGGSPTTIAIVATKP
jgi:6-phosphogluconolactonase (cycloisomerase 2 family)